MKLKLSDKGVGLGPRTVIEWSPDAIRVFEPGSKGVMESRLADVATLVGSRPVVVALSRRCAFVRTTRLPDAPKADVAKILQLQLDSLFPVASANLAVDFVMTSDRNVDGRLAIVVAAPTEIIEEVRNELRHLNIERIIPLAIGAELMAASLHLENAAIVEECEEGLSIDIIDGGHLRASRVVPKPSDAREIQSEIAKSFAMAKTQPAQLIAAGELIFAGSTQSVSDTSLGAISQHPPDLHPEPPQVSAKRLEEKVNSRRVLAFGAWILAVLVVSCVWLVWARDTRDNEKIEAEWASRIKNLKDSKALANSRKVKLAAVGLTLDRAFEPKQPLSDVGTVFTLHAPQGLWLTGMSLERGKAGTVRGIATTNELLTKYLDALGGDDRFRDVKLLFANNSEIEGQPVVNFSITAHIVGNFPLLEAEKKRVKR